jgi:hypothetical protein
MHLSDKRKQVIARIDDVFPTCVTVAIDDASFTSQYLKPYRAKHAGVIRRHEKKKKIVFCRECIASGDRGWTLAYKLFITATTNPLETKKEKWLNCQCQHCDFELNTPTPVPQPAPEANTDIHEQIRMMQDMLAQQPQQAQQAAYQQMQQRAYRTQDELRNKQDEFARIYGAGIANAPPTVIGGQNLLDPRVQSPPAFDRPGDKPTQHTMIQRAKKLMGG